MLRATIMITSMLFLANCFQPGGFDGLSYEEKTRYVASKCERYKGTRAWRVCIDDEIKYRSKAGKELNQTVRNVAGAMANMPTLQNRNTMEQSTSSWDNGNGLLDRNIGWRRERGKVICLYSDGSAINIGSGICPLSI